MSQARYREWLDASGQALMLNSSSLLKKMIIESLLKIVTPKVFITLLLDFHECLSGRLLLGPWAPGQGGPRAFWRSHHYKELDCCGKSLPSSCTLGFVTHITIIITIIIALRSLDDNLKVGKFAYSPPDSMSTCRGESRAGNS